MTDAEILAVETAVAAFAPDANIESGVHDLWRACREYMTLLSHQNPDSGKVNLANLQRINDAAYQKVLASIPEGQRAEVEAYVTLHQGKPLPIKEAATTVTAAIGAGKIVLPIKKNP